MLAVIYVRFVMRIAQPRITLYTGAMAVFVLCLIAIGAVKVLGVSNRLRSTQSDRSESVVESAQKQELRSTNLPYSVRMNRLPNSQDLDAGETAKPPKSVRERALSFYVGRDNVFFDELSNLKQIWEQDRNLAQLRQEFLRTSSLDALDADANLFSQRPRPVMERIAMLDVLKGYLEHDVGQNARHTARQALEEIVVSSVPHNVSEQTKKILVMEKYEALQLLAQYQPDQAVLTFKSLNNPLLARLLLPALSDGLARAGLAPELLAEYLRAVQQ